MRGAAADQLYSILLDTPAPDDDPEAPGEIGGVNPPNTLELRWMPATGGAATFIASAQGGRAPHFVRGDNRARLSRPAIAVCSRSRSTASIAARTSASPAPVPATIRRSADEIRLSPDGTRAFVSLQGRHFLVTVPMAGRETVDIRITGRGDNAAVPVKRMSAEGGDYLQWTRRRQSGHLGVGRAVLPAADRRRRAAEDRRHRRRCLGRAPRALCSSPARASSR